MDNQIVLSDLDNPILSVKDNLKYALCRFISEVQKMDQQEYPPNSLRDHLCGVQMYLETQKLIDKSDDIFIDLTNVLDNLMKDRVSKDMGVMRSPDPVSMTMENKMWDMGILGEDKPSQLTDILYLLGVNLTLCGGKHKKLRRPGFNP